MGLVSAVAPSAVKQGGGVTNQLSSMPQRSNPPLLLPPLQSLQEPGDMGTELRGRWAGLGSTPLTPTNPAEEEEGAAWQMGEEEGEEEEVGGGWRG